MDEWVEFAAELVGARKKKKRKRKKREKDIAKRRRMTQGLTVSLSTDVTLNTLGVENWLEFVWIMGVEDCFSPSPNADTNTTRYRYRTVLEYSRCSNRKGKKKKKIHPSPFSPTKYRTGSSVPE